MNNPNNNETIRDFVMIPRKLKNDYSDGKLTKNEYDILIWIWFSANPVNGFHLLSYEGLRQDLRNAVNYDNARKIISSLRKKQYIYFTNHKGRGGSFHVYPIGFKLTSGRIQTLGYVKDKEVIPTESQPEEPSEDNLENNQDDPNHNFEEEKIEPKTQQVMNPEITTPDNDNEIKIYKRSINDIKDFSPKSSEEERCWEIAKSLGERDIRFILSCLKRYGLNHIERTWGILREELLKNRIENKGAYFNKLINELWLEDNK